MQQNQQIYKEENDECDHHGIQNDTVLTGTERVVLIYFTKEIIM
jgi:hypothetical protein